MLYSFLDDWDEFFRKWYRPVVLLPSRGPQINDDGDTVTVKCELPGVEKEQIEVKIEDEYLIVKTPNHSYRLYVGDVKTWGAKAEYKNGVLTVTLPKNKTSVKVQVN